MPPRNKTDADSLAVAVVLTSEFAEIANVRVRLDHVASLIVNANHCIMGMAEKREMVRLGTGQAGDLTFSAANLRKLNLFERSAKCGGGTKVRN